MSSPETPSTTKTTTPEPPAPDKPISLYEQASNLVLHRILLALSSPNLLPSDLARLASATATLTRANAYAQTAELQRQLLRTKINKLIPPPEEDFFAPENLEKVRARVRAIYGIDWDFANPPADDPSWEPPPGFIGEYIPEGSSVPTIRSAHVKMCDTVRQSETFADKPGRTQNESPMPRQTPSPKTREERVESETCSPPSRAVLCPDTPTLTSPSGPSPGLHAGRTASSPLETREERVESETSTDPSPPRRSIRMHGTEVVWNSTDVPTRPASEAPASQPHRPPDTYPTDSPRNSIHEGDTP